MTDVLKTLLEKEKEEGKAAGKLSPYVIVDDKDLRQVAERIATYHEEIATVQTTFKVINMPERHKKGVHV